MKISLNWLKNYTQFKVSPQTLAHRLTMAGLEVEKISTVGKDTVFELEITPNRPDCLNFIGIAREVSAILNTVHKVPKVKKPKTSKKKCPITIVDKKGCLRYFGAVIRGVQVKGSPQWLKDCLQAVGLRSVNNIVDITNFVLLETGQPLHAFDYDKLEGGKIVVRRAKAGEKIIAIDEKERELDQSFLIIADAKRPVALAGIMGGKETEVNIQTKNILLESACFDSVLIRQGARRFGLSSDSSYRFERGVDMDNVGHWANRAIDLIQEIAGGTVVSIADIFSSAKKKKPEGKIKISVEEINSLLGSSVSLVRCKVILKKLGFNVSSSGKDVLSVKAPSFRRDIKKKVDVIEEIARIIGYDNLPVSLPPIKVSNVEAPKQRGLREVVRESLTGQGLKEIISYTLISKKVLEKTGLGYPKVVSVQNPLSAEQEIMRPSLLPSFLSIALSNSNKGQRDLKIYETGKIYLPKGEREVIGILMTGRRGEDWRKTVKEQVDFFDLKGAVESLLERIGIKNVAFQPDQKAIFIDGQCTSLFVDKKCVGSIGKLTRQVLDSWDIKNQNVFYAQIDLEGLLKNALPLQDYCSVCDFPAITRDISLAVREGVSFQQIQEIASSSGAQHLSDVKFLEEYRGEKIEEGCRGVVFSLTYQSSQRTLLDQEVKEEHKKILDNLICKLEVTIR